MRTLLAIYLSAVLIKVVFDVHPVRFPLEGQAMVFTWPAVLVLGVLMAAGLWLSRRAGAATLWDERVSHWQRFGLPTVIGFAYGLLEVGRDLPSPSPNMFVELPYGILFYTYGAIVLETMLRLFAVPLLAAIGRGHRVAWWIAILLVALYEPLPYLQSALAAAPPVAWTGLVYGSLTSPLFLANVLHGVFMWRYGWLATLTFRLAFYLVWHILYGGAH